MSRVDQLLKRYEGFAALPWDPAPAGPQRVWFVIHDKTDERRVRARFPEFELATKKLGHGWVHVDLSDSFAHWMASQEYREAYFEDPEALEIALPAFQRSLIAQVTAALQSPEATSSAVVAISGTGCLFGLAKVSDIVQHVAAHVKGRLVVFFPGTFADNNYRLFDARDGWDYLAIPITAHDDSEA